jgi:heme/copper-type cytochrome/quinol oxidase subunit 2
LLAYIWHGKSEIEKMSEQQKNRGSRTWYLLPIFFGLVGGMAMFFVLRDEDRQLAKNGVKLGAILTIVPIIIVASLWSVLFAYLLSDLTTTGATTTPIPDSGLFLP